MTQDCWAYWWVKRTVANHYKKHNYIIIEFYKKHFQV